MERVAATGLCAVLLALVTAACGTASNARVAPPWSASQRRETAATRATWIEGKAPLDRATDLGGSPARLVERQLHRRGLRFGTDGSIGALYGYVRSRHQLVPARTARAGDVVFFRMSGRETTCHGHVGLVEDVDRGGRVTFKELRDGQVRHSHFHPTRSTERRDETGRVINSFLRGRRVDDASDALYYAGQMVCAVGRIIPRP